MAFYFFSIGNRHVIPCNLKCLGKLIWFMSAVLTLNHVLDYFSAKTQDFKIFPAHEFQVNPWCDNFHINIG